jgi:hypothetical protein
LSKKINRPAHDLAALRKTENLAFYRRFGYVETECKTGPSNTADQLRKHRLPGEDTRMIDANSSDKMTINGKTFRRGLIFLPHGTVLSPWMG